MIGNDIIFLDTCMFLTHVYNCHDNKRISSDLFFSSIIFLEKEADNETGKLTQLTHCLVFLALHIFLYFCGRVIPTSNEISFRHFLMKS